MSRRQCYRCRQPIRHQADATVVETRRGDCTTWTPARLCLECASAFDRWLRTHPASLYAAGLAE